MRGRGSLAGSHRRMDTNGKREPINRITKNITSTLYKRECNVSFRIKCTHSISPQKLHCTFPRQHCPPHCALNATTPNSTNYGMIHWHLHSVPMAQTSVSSIPPYKECTSRAQTNPKVHKKMNIKSLVKSLNGETSE